MASLITMSAFVTANDLWPKQGPRVLNYDLAFTAGGTGIIEDDLFTEEATGQIEFVQTLKIGVRTGLLANPLTLSFIGGAMDVVRIDPSRGLQLITPIAISGPCKFRAQTTPADVTVALWFYNIPLPAQQW